MEVEIRGFPVYYEQYGAGVPILMLHGRPTETLHSLKELAICRVFRVEEFIAPLHGKQSRT